MEFRKAHWDDVEELSSLFDDLCDYLQEHGNDPGWKKGEYPTREDALRGIRDSAMYVLTEQGRILGTVTLRHRGEEGYNNVEWFTENDYDRIYVVCTLAVHPTYLRMGIAQKLLESAEDVARKEGCISLRLDLVKGNLPAENLYRKCGYRFVGETSLGYEAYGLPWFHLYEKQIDRNA